MIFFYFITLNIQSVNGYLQYTNELSNKMIIKTFGNGNSPMVTHYFDLQWVY